MNFSRRTMATVAILAWLCGSPARAAGLSDAEFRTTTCMRILKFSLASNPVVTQRRQATNDAVVGMRRARLRLLPQFQSIPPHYGKVYTGSNLPGQDRSSGRLRGIEEFALGHGDPERAGTGRRTYAHEFVGAAQIQRFLSASQASRVSNQMAARTYKVIKLFQFTVRVAAFSGMSLVALPLGAEPAHYLAWINTWILADVARIASLASLTPTKFEEDVRSSLANPEPGFWRHGGYSANLNAEEIKAAIRNPHTDHNEIAEVRLPSGQGTLTIARDSSLAYDLGTFLPFDLWSHKRLRADFGEALWVGADMFYWVDGQGVPRLTLCARIQKEIPPAGVQTGEAKKSNPVVGGEAASGV